jgi:hypothetical protein
MKRDKSNYNFANWNPLGQDEQPVSPQSVDADTYGETPRERRSLKTSRQVVRAIDIHSIYPDFAQPRRALPSQVRAHWNGDPAQLGHIFALWLDAILREGGPQYDVQGLITGSSERSGEDDARETPILEAGLLRLIDLAASIYHDGLLNPITVENRQDHFVLETGERRWLAYHLLFATFGDERWSRIPAAEVAANVWRQASENNARDNLNAVARARQYAILMIDLLKSDVAFTPYYECPSDRAFYAQVLDYRVPTGQAERLLAALGVTSRSALSRYRDILELNDNDWVRADDLNLSERELFRAQNNSDSSGTTAPVQPARPKAPSSFIDQVTRSFAEQSARLERVEQRIAKSADVDYSMLEPLIDEQIERLRRLKKRLRR